MGWADKLPDAKKGDVIQMAELMPGVTNEKMELHVLRKYGDRVTAEMVYFGIVLSKFVYSIKAKSFEEVS